MREAIFRCFRVRACIHFVVMNRRLLLACCATLLGMGQSLAAQTLPSPQFIDVGSERERILRVLQLVGQVRAYPWSIRAFSPNERDWLTPKSDWGEAFLPSESKTRVKGQFAAVLLPL